MSARGEKAGVGRRRRSTRPPPSCARCVADPARGRELGERRGRVRPRPPRLRERGAGIATASRRSVDEPCHDRRDVPARRRLGCAGSAQGPRHATGYSARLGPRHRGLGDQVRHKVHYRAAALVAERRGVVGEENRLNLYLILRACARPRTFGHVVEFGAYRCGNANVVRATRRRPRRARLCALDLVCKCRPPTTRWTAFTVRDVDLAEISAPSRNARPRRPRARPGSKRTRRLPC